MSYLVLARKWRPQTFSDLIGQETISHLLSNAISQGKVAHAYLFSGPRGVGKTTTARILARAVNCEKGPIPEPCGSCPACREILDGSSVDVQEIDGASNNSVNDIRDLRERVKYAPASGRYKVYIIDEVHMLSDSAFNALLKTLEEPPPHVIFVLATTAPRKIPATVISRCQHLSFRRIPLQKIKSRLRTIADAEGIKVSDNSLEMIAKAAEGSMRDALTILDQVISFSPEISDDEIKDLLGVPDFNSLYDISLSLIKGDRKRLLEIIEELTERGTDLKTFTRDLMNFFRDLLTAKVIDGRGDILDLSDEGLKMVKELTEMTTEETLTLLLGEIIRAEQDVRSSFSPRIVLELALIKASYLSSLTPLQEAIDSIGQILESLKRSPQIQLEKEVVEKTEISPESDITKEGETNKVQSEQVLPLLEEKAKKEEVNSPENLKDSCLEGEKSTGASEEPKEWERVLKKIDETNHPLFCKLSGADVEIKNNIIHIKLNGGLSIHADSIKRNKKAIEDIASQVLNRKVSVKVETVEKKMPTKKEVKEMLLNDPRVRDALELFRGRIVDIIENKQDGGSYV